MGTKPEFAGWRIHYLVMQIHYTLDDNAARLLLTIRSVEHVWDRAAELRNSAGVHLVELATRHVLGTGSGLIEELARYFESGVSDTDPYQLAFYDAHRAELEDLLRDLQDMQPPLVALHEVAELFPLTMKLDISFTLALTVVGYPAFGYVRTYHDSEGEAYHGLVVNLAQARAHLLTLGEDEFSLERLAETIRDGFFNHEGFLLAYAEYAHAVGRETERAAERLKNRLLSRGIAWYLSYRHDFAFYDALMGLNEARDLPAHVARCNALFNGSGAGKQLDEWPQAWETLEPSHACIDVVGYFAARAIAEAHGINGLREAVYAGPERFIQMYNALGKPPLHAAQPLLE
jgi:hypothetical protein